MQNQKRSFYIIGHNPNTIEEAEEYLSLGANALEPDIVYANKQFYVSHSHHDSYENIPTVQNYLKELKQLLTTHKYNLALIVFDAKDTNFDINDFLSVVKENFSGEVCDGVAISVTNADNIDFVNNYNGAYENIGVGVDESNIPPSEIEQIFIKGGQKNFSYADGITSFLDKTGVLTNIYEAQHCRALHEPNSFSLIYTWVLSLKKSMQKYLETYIDGIMVDPSSVEDLKQILDSSPYNEFYTLAENGYNPFKAAPIAKYLLTIKTKDTYLAGTDARILFTLKNVSGEALKSLPFNGNLHGGLDRDTINRITIEGSDLGEISSLTIEALNDDINSDWLPESIMVESKWLNRKLDFIFNNDTSSEEWLTSKGGAITKAPSLPPPV